MLLRFESEEAAEEDDELVESRTRLGPLGRRLEAVVDRSATLVSTKLVSWLWPLPPRPLLLVLVVVVVLELLKLLLFKLFALWL